MKVTIAIDSMKGSLSSLEAGQAAAEGVRRVYPDAEVCVRPLADGGEGTVEALTWGMGGQMQCVTVTGPLGEPVECRYGILTETAASDTETGAEPGAEPGASQRGIMAADEEGTAEPDTQTGFTPNAVGCQAVGAAGKIAVIEMSGAAGITLVPESQRNPLNTTTYGVGEVIRDAIGKGCRRFIVGIGGSATNDGGIGMLQALGYGILDHNGDSVSRCGRGLKDIARITDENVIPELKECTFKVACDVTNPLCGESGCSAVYGPQKGATPQVIRDMDKWLAHYAEVAAEYRRRAFRVADADATYPGTGAAGGLGFAFLTFTNAVLESGVKIVLEETKLEDYVKDADIVVTGEGRLDGQTVMGKAPIGVARAAKKYGKPVLGFSGCVTEDAVACNDAGIDAFFPILRAVSSLEEAMDKPAAARNMSATVEQAFRVVRTFAPQEY